MSRSEHNLFSPQPQKNAAVFFLQSIVTAFPDSYAIQVLSGLRQAATKDTKLLLLTTVLTYACPETEETRTDSAIGSSIVVGSHPLLPKYMATRQSEFVYTVDVTVSPLSIRILKSCQAHRYLCRQ